MKRQRDSITFKGNAANEAFKVMSKRFAEAPCAGENNDDWLKAHCNRHANGMCSIRACLMRGGYSGSGPVNYTKATCEAHEILCELEALRRRSLTTNPQ